MKKQLKHLSVFVLMVFFCNDIIAQGTNTQNATQSKLALDSFSSSKPYFGAISVNVGSEGLGLELKTEIAENVVLRFGYNHLPFSFTKVEQAGNVTVNGYYKARFNNWHLLADYEAGKILGTFIRLTGGVSYFTKANVFAHMTPLGSYKYGDIELNDGTMGYADINASWRGAGLYVGAGLGNAIPKTKMNYSIDFGTYYFTTLPKVTMETTGYLMGNENQRVQIQDNLKSYAWLPVIQLSLNYKL